VFAARAVLGSQRPAATANKGRVAENLDFMNSGRVLAGWQKVNYDGNGISLSFPVQFWHLLIMNAATVAGIEAAPPASAITEKFLRVWIETCDGFRAWERREILLSEASEKTLAQYRDALKWMLRLTRLLDAQVNDPDFPASRQFAVEVKGRLIQLQYSWEALNNSMSPEEADKLIEQYFPDEPRS